MARFLLSHRARSDLSEIRRFIADDNPSAADRLVDEFFDLFQVLARNPEIGQLRADLRPDLRSISHGNYVVFYYPMTDGAEIVVVVHGACDAESIFHRKRE